MNNSRNSSGSTTMASSPGSKEATTPTTTSRIGKGSGVQRTSAPPTAIASRRSRVSSITGMPNSSASR
ncbi:MAG: hypothetical protein AW12_02959 [Candidatus Accumulibacter sp. BA-94]|nr:MAG: hypothetical protein AW12_02959 [Candidatus Accumulibacter sp. BA-94]